MHILFLLCPAGLGDEVHFLAQSHELGQQGMQIQGLLQVRGRDSLDGRAQTIRLTAEGEEKMHQVQDARRQVFRERLGEWPVGDLEALAAYMSKLNATYERDGLLKDN